MELLRKRDNPEYKVNLSPCQLPLIGSCVVISGDESAFLYWITCMFIGSCLWEICVWFLKSSPIFFSSSSIVEQFRRVAYLIRNVFFGMLGNLLHPNMMCFASMRRLSLFFCSSIIF